MNTTGPGPLIKLTIEGVRGIAEFDCEPNGADLELSGDNGVGKSSATDALAWALGEDVDGEIVQNGGDKAVVGVKWRTPDGTILDVRRSKTKAGKPALTVKAGSDTKGSPATLLAGQRGTVGRRTFSTLPATEQIAIVKKLAPGLDVSDLDKRRAAVYEERTAIGRVGESLKGQLDGVVIPPPPAVIGEERPIVDVVDVAAVAGKKAEAAETKAANDRQREEARQARRDANDASTAAETANHAVEVAQRALAVAEMQAKSRRAASADAASRAADLETNVAALVDPDTKALDAEIEAAKQRNAAARAETEAHNGVVRAAKKQQADHDATKAQQADISRRLDAERAKYKAHTDEIARIDAEKAARIAAAASALPIAGIAIADGVVKFDDGAHGPVEARVGVLNDAACIELDVKMAAAQMHRLVVIRNAERLGKAARGRIEAMARAHGIQLVREVRTDGAELRAEVIEDAG